MFAHKKNSFAFQIVLGVVVLFFILLAVYFVRPSSGEKVAIPSAVDSSAYQEAVVEQVRPYASLDRTATSLDRLARVEETLNGLKQMRVPSEDKEAHLKLVIAFEKIAQGIRLDDSVMRADGESRLNAVLETYSWITP